MSATQSYATIGKVDKALISLLWNNIKDDPAFKGVIGSERQISLLSPKEVADSKTSIKLSVFLYQISEYTPLKNTPLPTAKNQAPPFAISLQYLFVPCTQNAEVDHLLLDKILQVFKDNPVIRNVLTNQDLHITMANLSPDDLNNIWTMLATPCKSALTYSISAVTLE